MSIVLIGSFSNCWSQQSIIKYLSGKDKDHTVLWDFYCTKGAHSGKWAQIQVPSCWELQGFGNYHYGWEENFRENESGIYRTKFKRDPSWRNKTIRIVFEGSMTDTEVKINGKVAGPKHQGSFYRFKYDITNLMEKDNILEVKVDKISSDTSVNRAERKSDFWVFGGIHRPVYLEVLPKQYIDWIAIDAKADGTILVDTYLSNLKDATMVEAQVKTTQGTTVGEPFIVSVRNGELSVSLKSRIYQPELWTPEHPKQYLLEVKLKNSQGVIHSITQKFGFRTIEFKDGSGFFVNGKKVIFKGVNRHTFWPTSGRTTSKEISIVDVNLIKDMNMNAVRMSHYPPEGHFLDVCDSLGLFVLDELTGWQKKYDTPIGKKLVKEMVIRDVNHPSIVIWDNGNEGGNNLDLVNEFAKYDPQKRKVIHPWNIFQGTDTQHYKGYDCCAGSLNHGPNVFFPTEFMHGLHDGGHAAGLYENWMLGERNPLFAGGFLWAFADEGIVRVDKDSVVDVKDNRAPDGIVGPYREKEASFYAIKEIWSPVRIKEEQLSSNFDGVLTVENKFLYTNLSDIIFDYKLTTLPVLGSPNIKPIVVKAGRLQGPPLDPGETGFIHIPKSSIMESEVLFLTATDSFGREIYTWSWPLKTKKLLNEKLIVNTSSFQAGATVTESSITLTANNVAVSIDPKTGLILSVRQGQTLISLSNGPKLSVGSSTVKSFRHYRNENNYVVDFSTGGELKALQYTMQGNGVLKIEYRYSLYSLKGDREFDFMGVDFSYPQEKITGVKYAGKGPYRVWKNRMRGNVYGIWDKPYNNTVTGESWDYPEFKGYYRDFQWVVVENIEHHFSIYTETEDMFLRLYTPERPKGATNEHTSPKFPSGDISILNSISPIGTKFNSPEYLGPEGEKNKIGWEPIPVTIYLDFR